MKNTSRNAKLLWLLGVSAFGGSPAHAFFGGGVVHDPMHMAQTMAEGVKRAAEAAQALQVKIQQYQTMIMNTISLRDPILAPIGDTIRALSQVYWQGQSLMYQAQNMDQRFSFMYPGYQSYLYSVGQGGETFTEKYRVWSERNDEGIKTSMKVSGMTVESGQSTADLLRRMAEQSATAGGQKQAVQAGNQIAALQVQELLKLQAMIDAQIKMQGNFLAIENERISRSDALNENFTRGRVTNSQGKGY